MKKTILILILLIFVSFISFAQSNRNKNKREEISIAPVAEANFYSKNIVGAGGGLALSYGDGIAFGVKGLYFMDFDTLTTLELLANIRFYILDFNGNSKLYAQIDGGPAFFFEDGEEMKGMLSGGITVGWRFLFRKHLFVEPFIRGGFPFLVGAGVSGGFRF